MLRRQKPWSLSLPWQPSFRRNWFARKNRSQVRGSRFLLRRACFRIFGTSLPPFDWMLLNSTAPSGGMHCTPWSHWKFPTPAGCLDPDDRICARRKLCVSSNKRTRDFELDCIAGLGPNARNKMRGPSKLRLQRTCTPTFHVLSFAGSHHNLAELRSFRQRETLSGCLRAAYCRW